jgi:uncharacterized protein (DUF362 family)
MSDNNVNEATEEQAETSGLDRRQVLAGAAVGVALASGLVGTDAQATPRSADGKALEAPGENPNITKVQNKPNMGKGRVVEVTHSGATTKIRKTDEAIVKTMVEEALKKFTGEASGTAALGLFFKKEDVVGIKVNCLGSPFAAVHPSTAFALADFLHGLGIEKNNIIIYDQYGSRMRRAKFRPLREGHKPKKDEYAVHFHETEGYAKATTIHDGRSKHKGHKTVGSRFPKVLERITAVINLCVPKDHDLTGVTGALKNVAYGNIDRVPIFHCKPECNPKCIHDGVCNVGRVYKHEQLGGKVKLVVMDALRVLYQGGPQDNMDFKKAHNAIMVSTDPVAIDRIILEIVNAYRKERKLKPVEEDRGGRRAPRFIEGAAKIGLGEADLAKIKWEKHTLG